MQISRSFLAACLLSSAPAVAVAQPVAPAAPSPGEIVTAAPAADWVRIAAGDLLVMDLAPDASGKPRRVVVQLVPAPLSQGWVGNIRKLAAAHWYDGNAVVRVQDDYVVQWGDPASEDETADGKPRGVPKALPTGLVKVPQSEYVGLLNDLSVLQAVRRTRASALRDAYADFAIFDRGWPLGVAVKHSENFVVDVKTGKPIPSPTYDMAWPIHCYGTVGVGRDMPPDTGSGAELYAVIGQAPRHLDRNIAVVGRVIEGIEFLSSLPRGTGPLGFYETPGERVPIVSVRTGDQVAALPAYEYLSTETASFARYADARANRRDAFFVQPAGGADICNVPVPVRRVSVR